MGVASARLRHDSEHRRDGRGLAHKHKTPASYSLTGVYIWTAHNGHQRPVRFVYLIGRLPTLPHTRACSTIGAERLNFRVRDGNGWDPLAEITRKFAKADSRRPRLKLSQIVIDGATNCLTERTARLAGVVRGLKTYS